MTHWVEVSYSKSPVCQVFLVIGLVIDTAAKIVYMTLQDCMTKRSGDFMEGNSSLYIAALPKLIAIDTVLIDM